jgi:hypothetical protein
MMVSKGRTSGAGHEPHQSTGSDGRPPVRAAGSSDRHERVRERSEARALDEAATLEMDGIVRKAGVPPGFIGCG